MGFGEGGADGVKFGGGVGRGVDEAGHGDGAGRHDGSLQLGAYVAVEAGLVLVGEFTAAVQGDAVP